MSGVRVPSPLLSQPSRHRIRIGYAGNTPWRSIAYGWHHLAGKLPEVGNTWLRTFLNNLLAPGDESYDINALVRFNLVDNNQHLFDPFIDKPHSAHALEEIARLRPRVHEKIACDAKGVAYVKTHNMLVDVAVSYSHHLDRSIEETIEVLNRDG